MAFPYPPGSAHRYARSAVGLADTEQGAIPQHLLDRQCTPKWKKSQHGTRFAIDETCPLAGHWLGPRHTGEGFHISNGAIRFDGVTICETHGHLVELVFQILS